MPTTQVFAPAQAGLRVSRTFAFVEPCSSLPADEASRRTARLPSQSTNARWSVIFDIVACMIAFAETPTAARSIWTWQFFRDHESAFGR